MSRNTKFPSLFFDSDKITNIREYAQKIFHKEELTAFYIIRPFSIYISLFIVNKTRITANSITFTMMLLSFFFPIILFYSNTIDMLFAIAPILFFILYILDIVDGEVARLREKISILGEFYDVALWFTFPLLFIVYIYKICEFQNLNMILFIVALTTVLGELFVLVSKELFCKKDLFNFLNKKENFLYSIILLIKFILSKPIIYLLYPVLFYLFNYYMYKPNIIFILFWSGVLFSYNIYSIIKFNKIVQSIKD